jgi:hypothetical protein
MLLTAILQGSIRRVPTWCCSVVYYTNTCVQVTAFIPLHAAQRPGYAFSTAVGPNLPQEMVLVVGVSVLCCSWLVAC